MRSGTAHFRFYEELNDFLPPEKRKKSFPHVFPLTASIKDVIESLGVPHAEIDLILVNGKSVDFSYPLSDGDHVSVYPVFESLDITSITRLHPGPLRKPCFILDVHLGKLARYLRLLGFDTLYDTHYKDSEIVDLAQREHRIILTRDIGILKNKQVTHGYWLRETQPKKQVVEIIRRFDLVRQCKPFTRCLECNGKIIPLSQENNIIQPVPPGVKEMQDQFFQCESCLRLYWQGTHYSKLKTFVDTLLDKNK
ncbi:Mut7-C RNAse domain-containing protein [Aquicella lusitana]|uniref:Twitching motility protein PilT n=1 Tax=Aquicella lusitana TaxID=254246 RepID=A0A370GAJ8_9COXI|nr:Mut7-C RNAse domain-containing protein [Aquicella lusitana]RDI40206.1 hypothetical protein C8D86_12342 [Aquicella lusitana]VVC72403.1 hypothetical protein AQULUS_01130 [Aquicella lusitana]